MSSMIFAIQSNLGNNEDGKALAESAKKAGFNAIMFSAIPFSDIVPDIPTGEPTVFYGGVRCMEVVV